MYDFNQCENRRNTNSLKWDVKENELPMWVADMDFQTAPEIQRAIQDRAAHGKGVADFLHRCGTGHFQYHKETYNTGGKGSDSDTGLQYIFQFYRE